ncbi:uncharacterized protein LOC116290288 [Actinia tenebrosa]|uniref:Uncharacterized protein LOC116290288 n=1 Tax=Actinia tenebrosa TaxID=6105 RepID=A0A6P8HKD2_ACTTE|nr:uncharacterized protein LOC116290288 [Actinia tenebrosa]
MSVESLIPMVNRWLEGVHSAMAINSASQDESSEDEIEDEEDAELSSPTSDKTASTTPDPRSGHDCDKRKPFKSRFFKRTKEKCIDYNDNVADSTPDLLPNIASKRSLSTEDLPRNLERFSGHYDIEQNSQEPSYFCYSHSHTKRDSFDSTVAQRPFSPCSTLAASDQFSVCEEDIVLMSPRFRGISSQRRASDGMVQRIPVQWTMPESNHGFSSSSIDVNGTCSRSSSRPATPATPVSPFIKIKASGGFKLPPLNAPNPRRPKLQELPSITISENSGSSSQGSLESFIDEQPCAAPKNLEQTLINTAEGKSLSAVKNAKHLLQRRRGSLPTVMSAIRNSALPIVKEEHPHTEEENKKPARDKHVNLQIPRHRFRSKSLDGQLGTASEWEQYKARAMERRAQLP